MKCTEIPVLFITFARPEYARKSFDAIKKAKPKKLYFYSNKARLDRPDEVVNNNIIRSFLNEIDWNCDVVTFFREVYVDVYESLWSAIDWIFENEERAIILEEDCVASIAFFNYAEEMLDKFHSESRIWVVSGNNFFDEYNPNSTDIIFSRALYKYGWACWRNRWNKINRTSIPWNEMVSYDLHRIYYSITRKQARLFIDEQSKTVDFLKSNSAWDYFLDFSIMKDYGFGIVPAINLVSNIGQKGVHNTGVANLFHNKKVFSGDNYRVDKFPPFICPDFKYDQYVIKKILRRQTIYGKIQIKISEFIHGIKSSLRFVNTLSLL
jgi:hypothetical protein